MEMYSNEWMDCKEVLRDTLEKLSKEFVDELEFSESTKTKYLLLLGWLNEYLYGYTDYLEIKSIKPGDVVSRFHNYAQYHFDFPAPYKKYLLRFFLYLQERGYENQKVIDHLRKVS